MQSADPETTPRRSRPAGAPLFDGTNPHPAANGTTSAITMVLDASALLALLFGEPRAQLGADAIADGAAISSCVGRPGRSGDRRTGARGREDRRTGARGRASQSRRADGGVGECVPAAAHHEPDAAITCNRPALCVCLRHRHVRVRPPGHGSRTGRPVGRVVSSRG
jgi:hypothetical protein